MGDEAGFWAGFCQPFKTLLPCRKGSTSPSFSEKDKRKEQLVDRIAKLRQENELRQKKKEREEAEKRIKEEERLKKEQEKKKQERQLLAERRAEFRVKCKRLGWLCSGLLFLVWVTLSILEYKWGHEFPYERWLAFLLKWFVGFGVVSYSMLNMVFIFEHYLTIWTRNHRSEFLASRNVGWRAAWNFWKYMMGDTIFGGCGKLLYSVGWKKLGKKLMSKRTCSPRDIGF